MGREQKRAAAALTIWASSDELALQAQSDGGLRCPSFGNRCVGIAQTGCGKRAWRRRWWPHYMRVSLQPLQNASFERGTKSHRASREPASDAAPGKHPNLDMPFAGAEQCPGRCYRRLDSGCLHDGAAATSDTLRKPDRIPPDRKLVRTDSLDLIVQHPGDSAERIRALAEQLGGYLESSEVSGDQEPASASVAIRVPAARFEEARATIRKLGLRVDRRKSRSAGCHETIRRSV